MGTSLGNVLAPPRTASPPPTGACPAHRAWALPQFNTFLGAVLGGVAFQQLGAMLKDPSERPHAPLLSPAAALPCTACRGCLAPAPSLLCPAHPDSLPSPAPAPPPPPLPSLL